MKSCSSIEQMKEKGGHNETGLEGKLHLINYFDRRGVTHI